MLLWSILIYWMDGAWEGVEVALLCDLTIEVPGSNRKELKWICWETSGTTDAVFALSHSAWHSKWINRLRPRIRIIYLPDSGLNCPLTAVIKSSWAGWSCVAALPGMSPPVPHPRTPPASSFFLTLGLILILPQDPFLCHANSLERLTQIPSQWSLTYTPTLLSRCLTC